MISQLYPKKYCCEPIENIAGYEDAVKSTERYDCHHILELTKEGEFAHTPSELKRLGLYLNRPASELIFLKHSEHQKMHMNAKHHQKGKLRSDKTRSKISSSLKGHIPWNKGIPCSDESKRKQSETKKSLHRVPWNKGVPMTAEAKAKLSASQKARLSNDGN